ncbi:DNA polymerase II large subunit [Candidatus Woesearchaeota archaeon]|nr:DNA polymerase II large subunit [Candidatus Woesearchaeota archaeon]
MIASDNIRRYFEAIKERVVFANSVASMARKVGIDPEQDVEIRLASNMAERVEGLISVLAPQILNTGVKERILVLEKEFGVLDWRVALKIAIEVAQGVFCSFKDKKEAIEIGIRTGFAYVTVGVVSSPLDGIVNIDIKKRLDGKEYFCVNFAGPIRNAGGTAAAVSVIIADYVRKAMGYDVYDAQPDEIKRAYAEVIDYHERISPRQYLPSEEEMNFLMERLPVEIGADPSETVEVSNYKDLARVPTNFIRSGFCLVLTDCIPLKAPKLWKQLSVWGNDLGLSQWNFLGEYVKLQKKAKAKTAEFVGVGPDYTYLKDVVAGRPVLGFPLRNGAFRVRYGRCRTSGLSAQAIHPATMVALDRFIACGTQLKLERPGKAASISSCSSIEGPVVRLDDGSVLLLSDYEQAVKVSSRIVEILFLGDILCSYGDYVNRAHPLVPAGYCEEWWCLEAKKAGAPIVVNSAIDAVDVSKRFGIPLHPAYCYHWNSLSVEQFRLLLEWLGTAANVEGRIVLALPHPGKRSLELIGLAHVVFESKVVVDVNHSVGLIAALGLDCKSVNDVLQVVDKNVSQDVFSIVKLVCSVPLRDKSGTFVGARMGRPEKAKMRKLDGSPHMLFPVGEQGGRMRSLQSCLSAGSVVSDFPFFFCNSCKARSFLPSCLGCGSACVRQWHCKQCGYLDVPCGHSPVVFSKQTFPIQSVFPGLLKVLGLVHYPALIKGVRGTSNKAHLFEHPCKGILRAKHDIYVNKDGTTRYDATQLPLTHFKPKEIGTSVAQLILLGYTHDIFGNALTGDSQIVEILPQDMVLPDCSESNDEGSKDVLFRVAGFVDEALSSLYRQRAFYGLSSSDGLIGQLVVFLAPHTSAGIVGRIIGFSKVQAVLCHPYMHSATRRDCDGDENCVILLMDALLNFSKAYLPSSRGATMDAPLVLTTLLIPSEVDDMAFDVDIASSYPLELYERSLRFAMPWEVKISQIKSVLNTPAQYEGHCFTHDTDDINRTVICSAYKLLPSMQEKLDGQIVLAEKIRAVDEKEVATLIIDKHFLRDAKGNLRQFSTQEFRCVSCNHKFRRPPLKGFCTECGGKLLFTVAEGSIIKYVAPMVSLAYKYDLSPYLKQTIMLLQKRIEGVFGRDKEKQTGLGAWVG